MINIKIELYGRLIGLFGQDHIFWQTQANSTMKALYQSLCQTHQVDDSIKGIKPVINDTFVDWNNEFQSGDVLGFLPPASGG